MSRLIDADALKQELRRCQIESLVAHTEDKNVFDIINEQPTAYDVDAVVEQIQNINTTWNCQKCEYLEICDKIQMEKGDGGEQLDLCAEVVKTLAVDIVRKGGKE